MWLFAPNIDCNHGFSSRHGGVSKKPFDSLNLGGHDDNLDDIKINQQIALKKLKLNTIKLAFLNQVHGNEVKIAKNGYQVGDALVSNENKIALVISMADCYPILFYDKKNSVIGAAHAGWRGTLNMIASNTIKKMIEMGAESKHIQVAIGQGISQNKFKVGLDVINQFIDAGFSKNCLKNNTINLILCNKQVLLNENILEKNIWSLNRCTFEKDFFSYRRDQQITGRMWSVIAMS